MSERKVVLITGASSGIGERQRGGWLPTATRSFSAHGAQDDSSTWSRRLAMPAAVQHSASWTSLT